MSQTITVYGPNLPGDTESFHVHDAQCADLNKGLYRRIRPGSDQGGWTITVDSLKALVFDVYDPGNFDYDESEWRDYFGEFHIFPCVTLPDEAAVCRHCERPIVNQDGRWIDPEAKGDDSVWRETCDAHDTFTAEHEPTT